MDSILNGSWDGSTRTPVPDPHYTNAIKSSIANVLPAADQCQCRLVSSSQTPTRQQDYTESITEFQGRIPYSNGSWNVVVWESGYVGLSDSTAGSSAPSRLPSPATDTDQQQEVH